MSADKKYKVVITGSVLDGFEREHVVAAAAKLFKCSESQAKRFLEGTPTSLKREMDAKTAGQYESHLKNLGVACHQKPVHSEPVLELLSSVEETVPPSTSSNSLSLEPSNNIENDEPSKVAGLSLSDSFESSASLSENASTPIVSTSSSTFQCPKCGTAQNKDVECIQCGIIFSKYSPEPNIEQPSQSNDSIDEVDEFDEIVWYVGSDIEKYRYKFRELYQNDGNYKLQWHWPAFLIPLPWLIYRKLYIFAAVIFILQVVTPSIMSLTVSISMGMLGNFIYYRHITQRLGKINSSDETRRDDITNEGGSNTMLVTIGTTMLLGFLMMFLFYQFFLPEEFEVAKNINAMNQQELNDAKDDPTKVKMLMLKNSILLHKKIQAVLGSKFSMPENMNDLREITKFPETSTQDKWGTQMELESSDNSIIFYSAGEDTVFDTDDDIVMKMTIK